MKLNDVYKIYFDTMYVTVIGNKCKTTVKHRFSNSIHQSIDMYEIRKLHNLQ